MATATIKAPCCVESSRCLAPSSSAPVRQVRAASASSRKASFRGKDLSLSASQRGSKVVKRQVRAVAEAGSDLASKSDDVKLLDVPIESEVGQTYEVLQRRLAKGEWEEADQETRRMLCVLAGEGAAKRKWVYFTEVQFIPQKDLVTIDKLWRAYSGDRFGFSVQRRIWKALGQQWKPFFLKIEWTFGPNSNYKKFPLDYSWTSDAPTGHMPLTNCLRGTQLLQALLLHPAFAWVDEQQSMPDDTKLPDYSKSEEESSSSNGSATSAPTTSAPRTSPMGLTGSIFDEDFNSADYGF